MTPSRNQYRLSPLVAILPFIEQQPLWEKISNPLRPTSGPSSGYTFASMGPHPDVGSNRYAPWGTQVNTYLCPSHPAATQNTTRGKTCYVSCFGDSYYRINEGFSTQPAAKRGVFAPLSGNLLTNNLRGVLGLRDCLDGTAHTVAMGEICFSTGRREVVGNTARFDVSPFTGTSAGIAPGECATRRDPTRPNYYALGESITAGWRGDMWADGHVAKGGFVTILPPNSPSCGGNGGAAGSNSNTVLNSAASYHQGGCHVVMADGAVRFITENIQSGDASSPTVCNLNANAGIESPYGLWGALGSLNGAENRSL
jgi:prepilin-type processing-associated H-X9-DG protein